jgi:hypothetical protein
MANYSNTVVCCEEHGTKSEKISEDVTNCQVTLRCAWASRFALVADIVGNSRAWPYLGAWTRPPLARSFSIVGDEALASTVGQSLEYIDALVTVDYDNTTEAGEDTENPETIVNESIEPNQEFQTLDYRKFKWTDAAGDPLMEAEAPGRPLFSLFLVRNIVKWNPPLPISILDKIGCVNEAAYVSARLGLTFAIGTLLYVPSPLSHAITTEGSQAWNVTLKFAYKKEGWNKFWRAKTSTYEPIWHSEAAAEYLHYPEEDLSPLLF